MTATNIVIVGIILALLSIVSIILLKVSSKEYPNTEEEKTPKFEVGKISHSHCSDPVETEKPKKKRKKYYKKKKPTNTQVEKRPVGRPKKSN